MTFTQARNSNLAKCTMQILLKICRYIFKDIHKHFMVFGRYSIIVIINTFKRLPQKSKIDHGHAIGIRYRKI